MWHRKKHAHISFVDPGILEGLNANILWQSSALENSEECTCTSERHSRLMFGIEKIRAVGVVRATGAPSLDSHPRFELRHVLGLIMSTERRDYRWIVWFFLPPCFCFKFPQVIKGVSSNSECVENISNSGVMGYLVMSLHLVPEGERRNNKETHFKLM